MYSTYPVTDLTVLICLSTCLCQLSVLRARGLEFLAASKTVFCVMEVHRIIVSVSVHYRIVAPHLYQASHSSVYVQIKGDQWVLQLARYMSIVWSTVLGLCLIHYHIASGSIGVTWQTMLSSCGVFWANLATSSFLGVFLVYR